MPSRTGSCLALHRAEPPFESSGAAVAVADDRPCCLYEAYVKVFECAAEAQRRGDANGLRALRDDVVALTGREGLVARIALLDAERRAECRVDPAFCTILCSDRCVRRRG